MYQPRALLRLVALALFPAFLACSQVLWVSPDGNDIRGDGSAERPLATIAGAVTRASENGGTIIVRDGTYKEPLRISRKFRDWLVIRPEHRYRASITAAQQTSLTLVDAARVEITGFDIYRSSPETQFPLAVQIARSENIILRDNLIHDSQNNDILKINEGSRRLLIIGNIFYNQEGPAGQHIDVNGCNDVVIRDNIFFNDFQGSSKENKRDTGSYIVIKNSSELPESRRFHVTSNIFMNWEGSLGKNYILLGEDAKWFFESQDVLIENNLMIGNGKDRMRAAFGAKGVKDVIFRNNSVIGRQPGAAYAMRLNREGYNPQNRNLRFLNNIWSDPSGGMERFSDGPPTHSDELELRNNLYWNGGKPIPDGTVLKVGDDPNATEQDPHIDSSKDIVLPRWNGEAFLAGSKTIRQEFRRLVLDHGVPAEGSLVQDRSVQGESPLTDILDRQRGDAPDLGAVEFGATDAPLRLFLGTRRITAGYASDLGQVVLDEPAGEDGIAVTLSSSDAGVLEVPETVTIAPGTAAVSFRVTPKQVAEPTVVVLTATAGNLTRSLQVNVAPEEPASVDVAPDVLTAGTPSSRNIVYLEGVAPAEGATVELRSADPEVVQVPESVRVAPGRSYSEYFPLRTRFSAERKAVPIHAKWRERSGSGRAHIQPSTFQVQLYTDSVLAGALVTGNRLYLDRIAPQGGLKVQLVSSHPELIAVPEFVEFPEGENMVAFNFQALATPVRKTVFVTAHLDGAKASGGCDVVPLSLYSLTGPLTITANAPAALRVALNGPAPEPGVSVSVEITGPAAGPSEVVIPPGQSAATFQIRANPTVEGSRSVQIKATYLGRTSTHTAVVGNPVISQLYTVPAFNSGSSEGGSIRVSAQAPPGGLQIRLSAEPADAVELPETVTIPEGSDQATFRFRTARTDTPVQVVLTARLGDSTQQRGFLINPAELLRFELLSTTVNGGGSVGVILTFRGIPRAATPIQMESSVPDVVPPVVFQSGDGPTQFRGSMPVQRVSQEQTVVIKATMGSSSLERSITVRP